MGQERIIGLIWTCVFSAGRFEWSTWGQWRHEPQGIPIQLVFPFALRVPVPRGVAVLVRVDVAVVVELTDVFSCGRMRPNILPGAWINGPGCYIEANGGRLGVRSVVIALPRPTLFGGAWIGSAVCRQ